MRNKILAVIAVVTVTETRAFAQLPPVATFDVVFHTESFGPGSSDLLTAHYLPPFPVGFGVLGAPTFQVSLASPVFPTAIIQTSRASTCRAFMSAEETPLTLGFDPGAPVPVPNFPLLFIPTQDASFSPPTGWLSIVDFRFYNVVTNTAPLISIPLDSGAAPYSFFVHPTAGSPPGTVGYASATDFLGNLSVWEISWGGGATPSLTGVYIGSSPPSQYVKNGVTFDPVTGNVLIAESAFVASVIPLSGGGGGLLTTTATFPAPAGQIVGTNIATNFGGASGQNILFATRGVGVAAVHGVVAASAATGASTTVPGIFGPGLVFAPGFHTPVVSGTPLGTIATFPLGTPLAYATGAPGVLGQWRNNAVIPGFFTSATGVAVGTPFGEGAGANPVVFQTSGVATDFLTAIGTATGQGLVVNAALSGLYLPASSDRPYQLPFSNEFVVHTDIPGAGGASGMESITFAPGPATVAAFLSPQTASTSLGTVANGGAFGPIAVYTRGVSAAFGFAGIDLLLASAPLIAPQFVFPYASGQFAFVAGVPTRNPIPAGAFAPFIAAGAAAATATFGARRSVMDIGANIALIHPHTITFGGALWSALDIDQLAIPVSGGYFPAVLNALIASELLPF